MKYVMWLLLMVCSQLTSAEEPVPATGMELLEHCRVYTQLSPMPWGYKVLDTNPSVEICLSYMNGMLNPPEEGQTAKAYCLPQDITAGQMIAVFVTYADRYPQSLKQETAGSMNDLLGKAFPCKGKP